MADLDQEEGRHRWKKALKQLSGFLSFLFLIYKIVRAVSSHL